MSNYPSKYSHMMRNLVWMHPARQTYLQSNQRQYQGSNKRPVIFHLCHHYMKARALKTFTVHQQQSTFTLAFPDSNKRIRLNDTQGKWVDTKAVHLPVLPGISDSLQILIKALSSQEDSENITPAQQTRKKSFALWMVKIQREKKKHKKKELLRGSVLRPPN